MLRHVERMDECRKDGRLLNYPSDVVFGSWFIHGVGSVTESCHVR